MSRSEASIQTKLYRELGYTDEEIDDFRRFDERMDRIRGYPVGQYPWDTWEQGASAAGLPEDLAVLGRSLIRDFYQHYWSFDVAGLCGDNDDGEAMIALALSQPKLASMQWRELLASDGIVCVVPLELGPAN